MKKVFVLFIVLIVSVSYSLAQSKPKSKHKRFDIENFKKQKADFITTKVGLTNSEALVFIPLMDELLQKKFDLNRTLRKESRSLRNKRNATSEDYENYLNLSIESGLKEAQLNKEYYDKFKKILSPQKIYKYKEAEAQFMKETVHKELKSQ